MKKWGAGKMRSLEVKKIRILNCGFRIAGVGLGVSLEPRTKNKAETDYEKLKKSGF